MKTKTFDCIQMKREAQRRLFQRHLDQFRPHDVPLQRSGDAQPDRMRTQADNREIDVVSDLYRLAELSRQNKHRDSFRFNGFRVASCADGGRNRTGTG